MNWNPVKTHPFGYWTGLSQAFSKREAEHPALLPNLRTGSELFIASDYSGREFRYRAISFVLLNLPGNEEWDERRRTWRQQYLPGNREMSFKKVRVGNERDRSLLPFLNAADCINGLLITFLFESAIGTVIADSQRSALEQHWPGLAAWKPEQFEKLFSVASLLGMMVAGLSAKDQNVWWLTDEDEIIANEQRLVTATEVFRQICRGYLAHNLGELRFGNDTFDQGTCMVKDLVALADLASGALTEMWHQNSRDGALPTGKEFVDASTNISPKSRHIAGWFAREGKPLKRLLCVFERSCGPDRTLRYSWPGFEVGSKCSRLS